MATTHEIGKETAPERRPRRRKVLAVAAVVAAGGLAAGLTLGLGGSNLPPESTHPQRDIVGAWTCTWPGWTAQVTFAGDGSERYSSSGNSAPGFAQRLSGSGNGTFIGAGVISASWEPGLPVYKVHIRGSQMILGAPSNPGETCTRK